MTGARTLPAATGAADADSLGIALTRGLALRAWRDSPTRFREDANLEEDLVLGGYRDRLVVELAQNAADAARRAGAPGRLRLSLRAGTHDGGDARDQHGPDLGAVLAVANNGTPLDAAGVRALATLRASAKRDEPADGAPAPVGRFGVGFAAVLEVSDEPAILSRTGGVRFDLAEARDEVRRLARDVPELGSELRRREGRVPVLRLPYRCDGEPPAGYDTVVVLPLRDGNAERLVRRLLGEIDDALLLTLPALAEITVDVDVAGADAADGTAAGRSRTLRSRWTGDRGCVITETGPDGTATRRWRTVRRTVALDPALLADRPVEERDRRSAGLTWAVRLADRADALGETIGDAPADERPAADPLGDLIADPIADGPHGSSAGGGPHADPLGGTPLTELPPGMRVVHAPTPTDEPLSLPALLIGDFPLDPTRRHLARGPLLDRLVGAAAEAYAALLADWPRPLPPALLDLVPGPVGVGEFDAALGHAVAGRLPDTPFLPVAADPTARQRPRDAVALDVAEPGAGAVPAPAALIDTLAPIVANLLPAGWDARPAALGRLGVRRLRLGDTIDAVGSPHHEPGWWHRLYQALADTPSLNGQFAREELGTLPVPLDDGRVVRGPRGVLLPVTGLDTPALRPLGLRLAHPDAAHPLLVRLGARLAEPRAVLADPAVAAAIDAAYEDEDPEPVAGAVLALVRAATPAEDERFGLDALLLPDADGGHTPAGELALPGSPLADVVGDALGSVAPSWFERWGADVLRAVGVLDTFDIVRADDVLLDGLLDAGEEQARGRHDGDDIDDDGDADDDGYRGGDSGASAADALVDAHPALDLDAIDGWLAHVHAACRDDPNAAGVAGHDGHPAGAPPLAPELAAIRDLDLVADDRWERALPLLAAPPLRQVVVGPTRLVTEAAPRDVPSYTAWWLGRHPVLAGRRPVDLLLPGADDLSGLYDPLPARVAEAGTAPDPAFLRAIGVRTGLANLLAEPEGPDELLDRLVRHAGTLDPHRLGHWYTALADVALARVTPPHRVCALVRDAEGRASVRVVPAGEVLVADAPDLLPLLVGRPYLPVAAGSAESLAELLDLDLASEALGGQVVSEGDTLPVPAIVRTLLPDAPAAYVEHDTLLVADDERDEAEAPVEVEWRVAEGVVHAATSDGLARGLAWVCGRWPARHGVAALLVDPDLADHFAAEADFEG